MKSMDIRLACRVRQDGIGCVTSLSISFLIYKTQIIAPTSMEVLKEDNYKHLAICLVHHVCVCVCVCVYVCVYQCCFYMYEVSIIQI